MAIRKRPGKNGLSYQVYWRNPITGSRYTKTFQTLAEARKHDASIRYQLEIDEDPFKDISEANKDRNTIEEVVFLYLRDKCLPEENTKKFLLSLRLPLEWYGHYALAEFLEDSWNELTKRLFKTKKAHGEGLLSQAYIHGILTNLRTAIRWEN